jgi:hypothetical protein
MKFMTTLVISFLAIHDFQEESPPIFSRMYGEWQRTENAENYEQWINGPEGSLLGENYLKEGENTRVLETISIVKRDNSWFYIPDVPHNPSPVSFKITKLGEDFFYSENPEHDFPKWIRYEFSGLDSMTVTIGDKERTVDFNFTRIP